MRKKINVSFDAENKPPRISLVLMGPKGDCPIFEIIGLSRRHRRSVAQVIFIER